MLGEVVCGFADCLPGFCLLQLVERVQDEGCFEEASVVAGIEAVHQPLVGGGFVEAGFGAVFDGTHGYFARIFMSQPVSSPSISQRGSQFFRE